MKERGNVAMIIIGIIAILFLVGFFRSDAGFWGTVNLKKVLNIPCGLTVEAPKADASAKLAFPLDVNGYVNGCGWNTSGTVAGTVEVFDQKGTAVTAQTALIVPADSTEAPFYFDATLVPIAAPQTDSGNMIFTSTTGLISSVPVSF